MLNTYFKDFQRYLLLSSLHLANCTFSKKGAGGLTGSQFLEGVAGKEKGDFFGWGLHFLHRK